MLPALLGADREERRAPANVLLACRYQFRWYDAPRGTTPCAHFHFISTRVAHKRVWGASCKSCSASARLQLGAYRAGVGVAALPALVVAGVGLALYKPTVAAVGAAKHGIEKLEAQYVARRERSRRGPRRAPVQSRRAARRSRRRRRAHLPRHRP